MRALVARWNDALNRHDLEALAALYDKTAVLYYGTKIDSDGCVGRIHAALAKDPTYHQDIAITEVREDVGELTYAPEGHYALVLFTKKVGSKSYDAYIAEDPEHGTIIQESDRTTDKNLVKSGRCFSYDSHVTLRGKVTNATVIMHDRPDTEPFLMLDDPICMIDLGYKEWDPSAAVAPQPPRIDTSAIAIFSEHAAAFVGKRVIVTGTFMGKAVQDFTFDHIVPDKIVPE